MKTIKTAVDLLDHGLITEAKLDAMKKVASTFSIAISPQISELIQHHDPAQAIQKQFVPDERELNFKETEHSDPIGDRKFSPVKGIVHRYPDRCLLKPVHVCAVYCRFCFRREQIGPNSESLSKKELEEAYSYIRNHTEIWEVILTGGDPLILNTDSLSSILKSLEAIPHIEVIRIHTRIPVVDSNRITSTLIKALKITKPVYIVLHANHASEFTDAAIEACAKLVDSGFPMLSQSVLLKGINDDPETLGLLMRTLVRNRIKPYYLHQGDLARGTAHFRTSIEDGQRIMKSLRGNYSGLCQPTYVIDIPGGEGKVPIGPQYLKLTGGQYELEDYQGGIHEYNSEHTL
jgi:lysine 2,3-aminomutase